MNSLTLARIAAPALIISSTLLGGWAAVGCNGTGPNVPPQPTATPTGVMPTGTTAVTPTGPQIVAPPTADPAGASQMNAQAMALYQQGLSSFQAADMAAAANFFTQATQADPKAYKAYYSLGVVNERLDKTSSALSAYQKSFGIVADYVQGMVAYGLLMTKSGSVSDADIFLTEKRGRLPKSAPIAAALAEVKSLQKDTASAQRIAQEALKLDPAYSAAMMVIARDHYRNRRLDLSLYALKAILDGFGDSNPPRDPQNVDAHLLRSFILAEQNQRAAALAGFKKVLELRPDLVVARLRVATYLLESGSADEALPILQKALKYDYDNMSAHLSLGDAYRLTGDYASAKQEFDWVKKADASLPQVHYNYGLLYLFAPKIEGYTSKQQVEAAIASFNKFKELKTKTDPSDVDELLSRANMKKVEIDALAAANKPQPPPPPPPPPPVVDAGAAAAPDDAGAAAAPDDAGAATEDNGGG